jgi:hypothetical protein
MAKDKHKNLTNRNQDSSPSSDRSTSNSASPEYCNTPEKQDLDFKLYLMIQIEAFMKGINNPLKEIQENTAKQVEVSKEKTQKSLKELYENTKKEVKKLNKTKQDLKNRIINNKEITKVNNCEDIKPRKEKRSHRQKHHPQNTRDRRENLRCRRYLENIETTVKENVSRKSTKK